MCKKDRVMSSSVNYVRTCVHTMRRLINMQGCRISHVQIGSGIRRLACHVAHLVHACRVHFHDRRVRQSLKHSLEVVPVIDGLVLEYLQQTALIHHLMHEVTHDCRKQRTTRAQVTLRPRIRIHHTHASHASSCEGWLP